MFEDMQNVETSMDDIGIRETDTNSHLQTVKNVLDICKCKNMTQQRKISNCLDGTHISG